MAKRAGRKKEVTKPTRVAFDYIKSASFRVIHADGAIGGVTPGGYIHMALYNERRALPIRIVFAAAERGLGEEISREEPDSFERELEVDVFLDLDTAQALRNWLSEKIALLSQLKERS